MNEDWDDDVLFTRTRTGDPDTSRAAVASIGEDGITELQATVLAAMLRAGVYGRTGEELSSMFDTAGSTYRTRLSELRRKGLCVVTKRRRYVSSGNLAQVLVHHHFATPEDTFIEERDGPLRRVRGKRGQAATDELRPRGAAGAPEGSAAAREDGAGGGGALDGGNAGVPRGAAPRRDDGVDEGAGHR